MSDTHKKGLERLSKQLLEEFVITGRGEQFLTACLSNDTAFFAHHEERWHSAMDYFAGTDPVSAASYLAWKRSAASRPLAATPPAPLAASQIPSDIAHLPNIAAGTAQSASAERAYPCSVCQTEPSFKCSECTSLGLHGRGAYFCSRTCQRHAWKFHKKFHASERSKVRVAPSLNPSPSPGPNPNPNPNPNLW